MDVAHIDSDNTSKMILKTPLYETHIAQGGRMVEFGGYHMPLQYTSILQEHMAVRTSAGLFDVSHMGEIFAMGPHAEAFVQHLITNDISCLDSHQALYTLMCNEVGGVLDDLLVYKVNDQAFMLVVNASNTAKDFAWMQANNPMQAELYDVSAEMGLLALQGPNSFEIAAKLVGENIFKLGSYRFLKPSPGDFMGFKKVIISRTGYTGDLGLEFYVESENIQTLWNAIMEVGKDHDLQPVGLGARDTLRLEAGFCLYGNELSEAINPYEARLGWVTKLNKESFIGQDALCDLKASGPIHLLIGLVMNERGIPRPGYPVVSLSGEQIGQITSGSQSPTMGCGIALAYVKNKKMFTAPGSEVGVRIRSRTLSSSVCRYPFYSRPN